MELLQKALTSLSQRDLSSSRKYALQALGSDPSLTVANRVLAVAGVLLAGDRRLRNDRRDFYAILQLGLADSADPRLVWTQFEKLGTLVAPRGNDDDVPFAAEAQDLLFEAWSVLSDGEKKSQYDAKICGTFWTVCPYCYHMFEYGKVYEECCLRCQNCERAFHAVAIREPSPEIVVPGKDQYYFCYGVFPLGYKKGDFNVNVNVNVNANGSEKKAVVDVSEGDSSDSSIDFGSSDGDEDLDGFWEEVMKNGSETQSREGRVDVEKLGKKKFVKVRARRMKNVKSVASKKAKRSRESETEGGKENDEDKGGNEDGNGDGELVFYEGDDDLFVGFEGTP